MEVENYPLGESKGRKGRKEMYVKESEGKKRIEEGILTKERGMEGGMGQIY